MLIEKTLKLTAGERKLQTFVAAIAAPFREVIEKRDGHLLLRIQTEPNKYKDLLNAANKHGIKWEQIKDT